MAAKKSSSDKETPRWVLYVVGGVLLVVTLTIYWFSEDMGTMFASKPKPEAIAGSWVFDQQGFDDLMKEMGGASNNEAAAQYQAMIKQAQARYGKMIFSFDKDSYSVDPGNGKVQRIECTYEGFPPNVLMVQTKDEKNPQQMHFSLDAKNKDRMFWNNMDSTIPLKRKE